MLMLMKMMLRTPVMMMRRVAVEVLGRRRRSDDREDQREGQRYDDAKTTHIGKIRVKDRALVTKWLKFVSTFGAFCCYDCTSTSRNPPTQIHQPIIISTFGTGWRAVL